MKVEGVEAVLGKSWQDCATFVLPPFDVACALGSWLHRPQWILTSRPRSGAATGYYPTVEACSDR